MRTLLLLFALLLVPAAAKASNEAVSRQHFERGKALVRLGEHRAAIREFELAYEANPRPSILYNPAHEHQVLAESGAVEEMRKAVDFYEKYLESQPRAVDRRDVAGYIAELKARIESAEAKARELPIENLPPAPAKTPAEDSPHNEPPPEAFTPQKSVTTPVAEKKKVPVWGWALVGVGGAIVVGGTIGIGVGLSQSPSPPASTLGNMGVKW